MNENNNYMVSLLDGASVKMQISAALADTIKSAKDTAKKTSKASKELAKALGAIISHPDYPKNAKFPNIVEGTLPECSLSGASAYKYAQTYTKIGATYPTFFDAFTIGKLVKALALTVDKATSKGATPVKFVSWYLDNICDSALDDETRHADTIDRLYAIIENPNSTREDKADAFKAIEKENASYHPLPDYRLNDDGTEKTESEKWNASVTLLNSLTDAEFSEVVKMYLESIGAKSAGTTKEEKTDIEKAIEKAIKGLSEMKELDALTNIDLIKALTILQGMKDSENN